MQNKIYFNLESINFNKIYEIHKNMVVFDKKKVQPKKDVLEKKYSFFIHNLISRQLSNDKDIAYLRAEVLKEVFGEDYKIMIATLERLKILKLAKKYKKGEKSNGYRIIDLEKKIAYSNKPYFYPYKPYVEKLEIIFKNYRTGFEKSAKNILSIEFYNNYVKSLNKLILNIQKAQNYIDIHFKEETNSKLYHLKILERYKEKNYQIKIPNEEDNRIYHILSSTPRELKYFLNIKYIIDIHNSHPIIFNSLIYDNYKIPNKIRYNLSNKIIDIYKYNNNNIYNKYYDANYIYNKLKDKGIDYPEIKELPFDVLRYIYLTSTGQFWDKVLKEDNGKIGNYDIIRQDIKQIMFSQVFYGKQLSTRGQKYAEQFKAQFPNVYKLILSYKIGLKKTERTVLAHKLMALESKLFQKALKRLFKKGYEVVSIHDAIVVLDTKANEKCTQEEVKNVLESVFKDEGLVCDCSVDEYGEKAMEDFLASERELRTKGEEYISTLRELAERDEDVKELIKDYEEGESEIIWSKDKTDVILHLKDIKSLMYSKRYYHSNAS